MKKIILKMEKLGYKPKREFLILGLIFFVFIGAAFAIYYFTKNLVYTGFCAGFAVVFAILFLNRYDSKINKINTNNLLEFSELFGFFRIYIRNGYNVYTALKEIENFANENLKNLLDILISEIDNDKTVQPFINFARNFDELLVEEMMISIYQMVDDGEQSNYLVQFEYIFDKFSDVITQKQMHKKDSNLGMLCSAPLIGSSFLIIVITIGIVGMIGELANGI